VILAAVMGVTSMAFAANGKPLLLGRNNVATAVTTLGGKLGVNGPMLRLANNNAGTNDTALELRVQAGEAPMTVNSDARVNKLNADKLDGRDSAGFLSSEIYAVESGTTTPADTRSTAVASCDAGDLAIGGGFEAVDPTSHVQTSSLSSENQWLVAVQTGSTSDTYSRLAVCADLPPLRP